MIIVTFPDKPFSNDSAQSRPETTTGAKKVLVKYIEGSSLKGLPKTYKATSRFQRWLWATAMVVGLAVGMTQVIVLLMQYFAYETTVTTVDSEEPAIFPAMSVCNANPLTMNFDIDPSYLDISANLLFSVFPQLIPSFEMRDLSDFSHLSPYEQRLIAIASSATYFQSLSADDREYLQNYTRSTMIQDCTWKPWTHETSASQVW